MNTHTNSPDTNDVERNSPDPSAPNARTVPQRLLGRDDLHVGAVGFGCMGLSQGYGPADDHESIRVLHAALEAGSTMLDTAMSYGGGHNEELLATALATAGPLADTAVVATKFGIVRTAAGVGLDGRPEKVAEYLDTSLARLGRDHVDLYYLHRVDPHVPIEETIGAMADLVRQGKVRHLGVSEVTPQQLAAAHATHPLAAVQFEWSVLWRDPEIDLVPAARSMGIGLVPYSPLGRGLLTATLTPQDVGTSDFRRNDERFSGAHLGRNTHQVTRLRSIAEDLGLTTGQLCLAWLLAQGEDVVPLPGTRRASRAQENAAAAVIALSSGDLRRIDDVVRPENWSGNRRSFAVPTMNRRPQ